MNPTPLSAPPTQLASEALKRAGDVIGPHLDAALGRLAPELAMPIKHHFAGGGKHLRAALVMVSSAASRGPDGAGIPGAVAIELVHNFSLLHDDIIDGDRERRHRPTVWSEFGIGAAIVAGDALAALATQVLLDEPTPERVRAAGLLAMATQEMIGGQADDMAFESRASISVKECLGMMEGKTGALLSCAAAMGAILSGATDLTVQALADFGRRIGIAFQAMDDVLGIWGEPSQTGKPAGNDLVQHKKTLPVAMALEVGGSRAGDLEVILGRDLSTADVIEATRLIEESGARHSVMEIAESYLESALTCLEGADLLPAPRCQLEALARFVTERDR